MSLNPETLAMMAALQGGNDKTALCELLAGAGEMDPQRRAIFELLANQSANGEETTEPSTVDQRGGRRRGVLRRAKKTIMQLREQRDAAYKIIDLLAAATGACKDCFGDDRDCPRCDGRGGPGTVAPDRELYQRFIEPVFSRVQTHAEQPSVDLQSLPRPSATGS